MNPPHGTQRAGGRVVLVRHGESIWNAEGRFQGQRGPGLTPLGHAQARATAVTLRQRFGSFGIIVRSDLVRVAETARPAEALLGVTARVDVRWRELDVGTWSGRTHQEVLGEDRDAVLAWRRGEGAAPGGGESLGALRARVDQALADLGRELAPLGRTALVFTHGGPIRAAVALAGGAPTNVPNCSVTLLEWSDQGLSVVACDEVGHLPEAAAG